MLQVITTRANRLARSRLLTFLLLVGSAVFVAVRWRDARWDSLGGADVRLLAAGALMYAVSLAGLIGVVSDARRDMAAAGASTQLLKYLPGGIWQGQPLLAAGDMSDVGAYAWGVVVAAATAATIGVGGWPAYLVGAVTAGLGAFGVWRFGGRRGTVRLAYAVAAGTAMVVSGVLVSVALDGPGWPDGRAVGLSWAAGVVAVPVPAGLGVREAMLAVLGGAEAAPLAAAHRLVTFLVDVIVGTVGWTMLRKGTAGSQAQRTEESPS